MSHQPARGRNAVSSSDSGFSLLGEKGYCVLSLDSIDCMPKPLCRPLVVGNSVAHERLPPCHVMDMGQEFL